MKRQLAKITLNGIYRVVYDDSKKVNPYRITRNGKKVVDFADYVSCLYYLADECYKPC